MKILVWVLIGITAVVLGLYAGASWYFANILIDSPTQTLEDGSARAADADIVLDAYGEPEPVSVQNGDVTLAGEFYDNPLDGDCGVLMLHGYTGTRYGTMQYAPLFWDRGCDLLIYDARGHGESSAAFHTYGFHERDDAVAVYDYFSERAGLTPEQIGLVGISYGAGTSLQAAPLLPDAAFILADAPYADLPTIAEYQGVQQYGDWIGMMFPGAYFFAELRADFDAQSTSAAAGAAEAEMPLLIVHSQEDEFTPAYNSEAIYDVSDPSKTVLAITEWGAAHGRSILEDYDAYEQIVDEFLATYAPDFGASVGQ